MYILIIFVNSNLGFVALRSIISSIASKHVCDSYGIRFLSMRHNPADLSVVSCVDGISIRFVPMVSCTSYAVAVSTCSNKVGRWFFVGPFISTIVLSFNFVVSVSFWSFYHTASSLLNFACQRESVRFPSRLVSLPLVLILHFILGISLSRYRINHCLILISTLALYAASILILKSLELSLCYHCSTDKHRCTAHEYLDS